MPSVVGEFILFCSSFSPLLVVFALLETFMHGWKNYVILIGLAVLANIGLALFLRYARGRDTAEETAKSADQRDGDVIGYVATYILPFAALGALSIQDRVALLFVFAVIACLYIRAHLFYVNPVLALFGFRLFDVDVDYRSVIVISKQQYIAPGSKLKLHTLSDYVFLEGS